MACLRTALILLAFFTVTHALLAPHLVRAAKHRAMLAARLRRPLLKRTIAHRPSRPIVRRPVITKPIVKLVKVPLFVPKLLGARGLTGLAKSFTRMLNPLAPTRHYPTLRNPSTARSSERPKIEKSAEDSSANSSGHWADKMHKNVHPVDRPKHVTRSLLSRAFRSFINHDEHTLENLGPLFQPAHHTLSAAGSIVLPHPREEGIGQPLNPLLFHQWPKRRP